MNIKLILLKCLPPSFRAFLRWVRAKLFDIYVVKAYSQEGEDLIMQRIFAGKTDGFYVDVGAHHPRRFSNTYLFYRQGWRGINVEPNPDFAADFMRERKRDINLQLGVSDCRGTLTYYQFNDPALNSFDKELTDARLANTAYKLVGTQEISVERLERVLEQHVPSGVKIDFLSIDVEGLDMAVLRSNNWSRYRPRYVLAESLETSLEEALQGEVYAFMKTQGYKLFGKTLNTLIFQEVNGDAGPKA